jgi:rhamnosyl/mannosyltransferase
LDGGAGHREHPTLTQSARPRVVHVYKDVFPPVPGGIERVIGILARRTREAFDPRVLVAAPGHGRGGERTIEDGIPVTEVASLGRALSTPLAPGFVGALRDCGAELLHFHVPHPTGEVAFLLSGLRVPAVVTYHSDVIRQRWAMNLYGPMFHRFLARMAVIMPTSQRYLETSPWLAPHRDRCRVVPLGLPLEDYAATEPVLRRAEALRAEHGDYVLFLGCLRAYKGISVLLEAMRRLPQARLLVAGEGAMGPSLREEAARLGLGDRARFLGRVAQEEAVALLTGAAMLVLPSIQRSEAFGLVQVEAMACGAPVICTDLPTGVPEVNADGLTGLVVPPRDAGALTAAIERLLNDPAMRRQMGEAGRRRAQERFGDRRMADQVMDAYRFALSQGQ